MQTGAAARLELLLGQHSEAGGGGRNQDFHGAALPEDHRRETKGLVVALADGIGSSPVSHIASAAAVRGFLDDYYCTSEAWTVRRAAQRVLEATNAWLHAQTQRGEGRFDKDRGHVCTFSALVFKGREAHLLHVGDTRIYRVHRTALEQLSEDHRVRLAGADDQGGRLSYLGRALGIAPRIEIDHASWPLEPEELYLLATDGAYEYLDAAAVQAALQAAQPAGGGPDLSAAARALVAEARRRGSSDDATVQLVRVAALPPADAALPLQARREGLALPPALVPRARFEGYRIVRELHASARSHVHLALDETSGARVALKTPAVGLRDDADYLDRFVLEEWVARRLDSPHVLKAGTPERPRRHLFVAMEYVEGQTLAQWMSEHPRPTLDAVRRIVEQLARGLQAIHRKQMLHQDLRPQNVLIDATGTVKIIDFAAVHVAGLAEGSARPRPEAIVGELQYTAPEYFSGEGGSPASDLFSLAVLCYQMLTGTLPYGLQVARMRGARDLRRLRYTPLRDARPELPAWLDAVLCKALQPQPARRHEALSEFIADLHRPAPALLQPRTVPLAERHPVAFWRTLAVLLALACVVLAGLLLGR